VTSSAPPVQATGALSRLLSCAGETDPALTESKLRAFRRFLLLYSAARSALWIPFLDRDPSGFIAAALWLALCAALVFRPQTEHWAPRLALPALALQLFLTFPLTDNHFYLEVLALCLVCLAGRGRAEDDALVLQGLHWLCAIVLFQTGLQKLLYGHYLTGDFLAFMVAAQDRFGDLFGLLLSADTVVALRSHDVFRTGAGPFRVDSLPLVVASNAVWIAELVLPGLLLWRRTRTAAMWAALALVVGIQTGAREFGFMILFSNLLLLFAPGNWNGRILPILGIVFVLAILLVFGLMPIDNFLDPGSL